MLLLKYPRICSNVPRVAQDSNAAARLLAEVLLADELPQRWRHVSAVATRASHIARFLGEDGDLLVSAAWLDDVGYSTQTRRSGFHPLDGAVYLRNSGYPERLCALVAHHSAAKIEARYFACLLQLQSFLVERTLTRDLLWYCDMTVGPQGARLSLNERMHNVRSRYAADHYVIQALDASMPARMEAVARAEAWIESVGLVGQV